MSRHFVKILNFLILVFWISDCKVLPDSENEDELISSNITNIEGGFRYYYNSSVTQDDALTLLHRSSILTECTNFTVDKLLSNSYRRARVVDLPFDFPFYGHPIKSIMILTGGFIYTGEYFHWFFALTQYISPLMANFDTTLSDKSLIKYCGNEKAFHVFYDEIILKDDTTAGNFTFSVSLYKNGDIVFAYYSLPISINEMKNVKLGLSDAYLLRNEKRHTNRKTIYEYHRLELNDSKIVNSTIVRLTALPSCITFTDCISCLENDINSKCNWCPSFGKCSTEVDYYRQEWLDHGCPVLKFDDIEICPGYTTTTTNTPAPIDTFLINV